MGLGSRTIVKLIPLIPRFAVRRVARPYVAGEAVDQAVSVVARLNKEGALATMAVLGEEVRKGEEAAGAVEEYIDLLEAIRMHGLDSGVSVKPSHFGARISHELCVQNMRRLHREARSRGIFVRLDMEDHTLTDLTLRIHKEMLAEYGGTGIVLQAALRRTLDDIDRLPEPPNVRLCKGIYIEPEALAFRDREQVRANFLEALDRLLARKAYVGIATHDAYLIDRALMLVQKHGLERDRYEFQMLLGVLPDLRRSLIQQGHRLRVYVPYGRLWYEYSKRRLRENPDLAGHIVRALFRRKN